MRSPWRARRLGWRPAPTYAALRAELVANTPGAIPRAIAAANAPQRAVFVQQAGRFVAQHGAYAWRRARLLELVDVLGQLPAPQQPAARQLLGAMFLQIGDPSVALLLAEGLTDARQRAAALSALLPALRHLSETDATQWRRLERLVTALPAALQGPLQKRIAGEPAAPSPAKAPAAPTPTSQTFDTAVHSAIQAGDLAQATALARTLPAHEQLDTRLWILQHHLAFNARPVTAWQALAEQLSLGDDTGWELVEAAETMGHYAGALALLAEMPEDGLDARLASVAELAERALEVGELRAFEAAFKRLGTMEYMEHPEEGDCISEDQSSRALAGAQQLELLPLLADTGAAALAQRLARKIAHPMHRAQAHATLAEYFIGVSDYTRALSEAQAAGDPRPPKDPCAPCEVTPCPPQEPELIGSEALLALADAAAAQGRIDIAMRAFAAVPNPEDRADLALTLADQAVAAGLTDTLLRESARLPAATDVRVAVVDALASTGRLSLALDVANGLPAGASRISARLAVYEAAHAQGLVLGPLAKRVSAL